MASQSTPTLFDDQSPPIVGDPREVQMFLDINEPDNIYEYMGEYAEDTGYAPTGMPEPTAIQPGPDKVKILCERLFAGKELWHPEDAKLRSESQEISEVFSFFQKDDE